MPPPKFGGNRNSKSPKLGGFRGLINIKRSREDLCVHRSFTRGENSAQSPRDIEAKHPSKVLLFLH
jgi:hypothetical protein